MLDGVTTPPDPGETIAAAWSRVASEQLRATRAAAIAVRHDVRAEQGPPRLREFHTNMAALHRTMQGRHQAAVALHSMYARRLQNWQDDRRAGAPPLFMSAVATISGSGSALITLREAEMEALVATSDRTAETAHDLESTFGEGPTRDTTAECRPIAVRGDALEQRWPLYGPMVRDLGVRSIVAAPLRVSKHCFGALTVFHREMVAALPLGPSLDDVADALTHTVLLTNQLPLFEDADCQSVVNHAAGIVAQRYGCTAGDALALIRACAFTRDERIATVAARVARGELIIE